MALTIAIHATGRYRSSSDLLVGIAAIFLSVSVLQSGGKGLSERMGVSGFVSAIWRHESHRHACTMIGRIRYAIERRDTRRCQAS